MLTLRNNALAGYWPPSSKVEIADFGGGTNYLELYTMLVPVIFLVSVFTGIRYSRTTMAGDGRHDKGGCGSTKVTAVCVDGR